jgi:hypothetical protein
MSFSRHITDLIKQKPQFKDKCDHKPYQSIPQTHLNSSKNPKTTKNNKKTATKSLTGTKTRQPTHNNTQ